MISLTSVSSIAAHPDQDGGVILLLLLEGLMRR